MDNKKHNENANENISFVTDEEALKEIDFGSFLDEASKDAPVFEGFHEDIEKTEKSLENELQSLYDNIVNSGPATIVPKPLSVITSEEDEEKSASESGLEELWMNPEDYFDAEIPVVSLDGDDGSEDDEKISEEAFFKPESKEDEEEKKAVARTADEAKDDIFGMINSMKSETDSEKGFGDILAEIEANSEISPVADDFDSIAGFLSTLPVSENDDKVEVAETEKEDSKEVSAVIECEAEEKADEDSDVNADELEVVLEETADEEASDSADSGFVVNIPDDGNDYSFAAQQNEDDENAKQPQIFFGGDSDESYERPAIEQSERVIGDFEAAQRAALEASVEETKEEKKARKQREKEEKKNGEKKPIGAGEIVRRIVLAISILVIFASGVVLVNTYVVQPNIAKKLINDTVSGLADSEKEHGDALVDSAIRSQYDVKFPDGMLAKYAQLYAANTDLKGWISIPAFEINLPVVQGADNDYYLKRNIYKKWTEYGVPFFDYRIAEEQFATLPRNTVIYGHNMRSDDLIFGMLEEYRDIDGFKKAPVIECNTIYGDFTWLVCGVFISNGQPEQDNGYVFPYNFIDCSDQKFAEYIVELEKRSFYDTGVDLAVTDKILTLSTCCYDFEDARLVVVARLLREGESVSVDTSKAVKNPDPKGPQAWCDSIGKPNNHAYDARW